MHRWPHDNGIRHATLPYAAAMYRLAVSRFAVPVCVTLLLAGVGGGLVTARWVPDWLRTSHHRATVAACQTVYERPIGQPLRQCYSRTTEGLLYVRGAGQGHVGDEFLYIVRNNTIDSLTARSVRFGPSIADWVFVAVSLAMVELSVVGLAMIAYSRMRLRRSQRRESASASNPSI